MSVTTSNLLYEGKAKKIFAVVEHPESVLMEFKDSLTAFNALKKGSFDNKGRLNRQIASLVFRYLQKMGVASHWQQDVGAHSMLTLRLQMIPLEVVVRNVLAGSTAKKFALEEGTPLEQPLVELYFKSDALADPFISDEQALMLKAADEQEIKRVKELGLIVNHHLKTFFAAVGLQLIDFKVEFGRAEDGRILLADEITPDSCRLWDVATQEKMDKDRFRRDLGRVKESYEEVYKRLRDRWESEL